MNTTRFMGNKKLCIVLSALSRGGVVFVYSRLAHELIKLGWDVQVVSLMDKRECEFLFKGIKVTYLGGRRLFSWVKLARFFRKNKQFDVILSAVDYVNIFTTTAKFLSGHKAKHIATVHSNVMVELEQTRNKVQKIVILLSRIFYKFPQHFVAVSLGVKASLMQLSGVAENKVSVIYNPIDLKNITDASQHEKPHPLFQPENKVIVACGRLEKQKDFELLINAFSLAASKDTAMHLMILGEGSLRSQLEELAAEKGVSDRVIFAGVVNNVEAYMAHADLFVLSSAWEGFGNVIIEALGAGCPVVSMDCPSGPAEILEDGQWGILVKERSAKVLSEAILRALKKPPVNRKALQHRALDFTPEKIADAYLTLMEP